MRRLESGTYLFRLSSWLIISLEKINKPQGAHRETCVSLVTEFQVSSSFLQVTVLLSLVQQLISLVWAWLLIPWKESVILLVCFVQRKPFFLNLPLFKVVKFPEYLFTSFLQGCYEAPDRNSIFLYSRRLSSNVYMIIFALFCFCFWKL